VCEHLALGTLAAVGALEAMAAGGVALVQVALGQPVKAQQQVIEAAVQVLACAGNQGIEVFGLVVERLQDRQLQLQPMLANDSPRFLDGGCRGAVGVLRVERCEGDLADALAGQADQRLFDRGFTVAHGQFDRPLWPVRADRLLQAPAQYHQRRTLRPPDRGVGVCRLLRALDQDQRNQQAP